MLILILLFKVFEFATTKHKLILLLCRKHIIILLRFLNFFYFYSASNDHFDTIYLFFRNNLPFIICRHCIVFALPVTIIFIVRCREISFLYLLITACYTYMIWLIYF